MLTITEASRITGIKVRTIRSWIEKGQIMSTKFPGSRRIAIPESEIDVMRKRKTPNFCINSFNNQNNYNVKKQGEEIKAVILQRDGNDSIKVFDIFCHENKGRLITTIKDAQGEIVAECATEG